MIVFEHISISQEFAPDVLIGLVEDNLLLDKFDGGVRSSTDHGSLYDPETGSAGGQELNSNDIKEGDITLGGCAVYAPLLDRVVERKVRSLSE